MHVDIAQWAKSPKKQSVGVYTIWHCINKKSTPSDCFFAHFAHWER